MRTDIDSLMQEKNMDAIMIIGNSENNPAMFYMTGGGHIRGATLIKKRGQDAVLYCNDMERDEAAKTGLRIELYSKFPKDDLMKFAKGDVSRMQALQFQHIFKDMDLEKGQVGLYGKVEVSSILELLTHLKELLPHISLTGESDLDSIFSRAMETKDDREIERIRKMGLITVEVIGLTADYLTSCEVRDDEVLISENGSPLLLGEVKSKINLWLAERNAFPSEGFIFAIGRDAGVPHSVGNPHDFIRLGQTIVFDLYPQEIDGGYFYDFTRTWSLGYASPQAQELYDQVKEIYHMVVEKMEMNTPYNSYQRMTCEYFESKGHQTLISSKAPMDGYVHSLGHGLGINLHERPFSSNYISDDHRLAPGVVVTVEPGLYYPDKGMGFRIEDSYWARPDGKLELLAEYPYDFVLPMKKWNA